MNKKVAAVVSSGKMISKVIISFEEAMYNLLDQGAGKTEDGKTVEQGSKHGEPAVRISRGWRGI